jgi:hypothetical protein
MLLLPSFPSPPSLSPGYGERFVNAFDDYGADSMLTLEVSA